MNNNLYNVTELPETREGKFGGYKVLPSYSLTTVKAKLHPIQIHLKYDMNKELDLTKSNNGILR